MLFYFSTIAEHVEPHVAQVVAAELARRKEAREEARREQEREEEQRIQQAARAREVGSDGAATARLRKVTKKVKSATTAVSRSVINFDAEQISINPLAPYLGPVQKSLGKYLVYLRAIRAVVLWEE